jgi:hypothetical protein
LVVGKRTVKVKNIGCRSSLLINSKEYMMGWANLPQLSRYWEDRSLGHVPRETRYRLSAGIFFSASSQSGGWIDFNGHNMYLDFYKVGEFSIFTKANFLHSE